jgi:hypothetical protein
MKIKTAIVVAATVATVFISQARGDTTNPPSATSASAPSAADAGSTNGIPPAPQSVPAPAPGDDAVTADTIISTAKTTYAALQSYSDTGTAISQMGAVSLTTNFNIRLQRPALYRIDWQGSMSGNTGMPANTGVTWSDSTGDFLQYAGLAAQKQPSRELALGGATGISAGAAAHIPGTFFNDNWGGQLNGEYQRKKDETVAGADCYVVGKTITRNGRTMTTTLWIGKQDNLIHQLKISMEGLSSMPSIDDAGLKSILTSQNKPVTPEAMAALKKELTDAQEKAAEMLKSGKIEFIESHTGIVTNKTFAPADFKPQTN